MSHDSVTSAKGVGLADAAMRWQRVIIVLALAWFVIRVAYVRSEKGDLPFQSANDRSRWCTVCALVDHHTFAIDEVIQMPGWNTIDKVYHTDREGVPHYYSSKPPLLSTLVAGLYWLVQSTTGWTLKDDPFPVMRTLLVLFNGISLVVFWESIRATANRFSRTVWSATMVIVAATWGTHLTSFAVTLNNHLPAAAGVALSQHLFWKLLDEPRHKGMLYGWCGLAAAWGFSNEIPALGFLVAIAIGLFFVAPRWKFGVFAGSVLAILVAMLVTNWLAHDSWAPPYLHRKPGADYLTGNWYVFPKSYWLSENRRGIDIGEPSRLTYLWNTTLGHHGVLSLTPMWLMAAVGVWNWRRRPGGWGVTVLILGLSLACGLFWEFRPLIDRNYSGRATAFRWVLWMAPLWLMAMIPCLDRWGGRPFGRKLAYVLLTASILSAAYGWYRPWQHPWLYREALPASSSSKTAFIKSGQTTVASAYTSAWRPPSRGATNFPQLTPSE